MEKTIKKEKEKQQHKAEKKKQEVLAKKESKKLLLAMRKDVDAAMAKVQGQTRRSRLFFWRRAPKTPEQSPGPQANGQGEGES